MTATPKRIQLSRARGWKLTDHTTNYVIIDRRGPWGNPWGIQKSGKRWSVRLGDTWPIVGAFDTKDEAQECAVGQFRRWLADDAFAETLPGMGRFWILESLDELAGKDLACWCPTELACHATAYFEVLAAQAAST